MGGAEHLQRMSWAKFLSRVVRGGRGQRLSLRRKPCILKQKPFMQLNAAAMARLCLSSQPWLPTRGLPPRAAPLRHLVRGLPLLAAPNGQTRIADAGFAASGRPAVASLRLAALGGPSSEAASAWPLCSHWLSTPMADVPAARRKDLLKPFYGGLSHVEAGLGQAGTQRRRDGCA